MGLFKFLKSLRTLANNRNITIKEAYKFAEQEFGQVSDLLKMQINKIFKDVDAPSIKKPSKPEGKVIEASFKPGKSKYSDKIIEESPSQRGKTFDELLEEEKSPVMTRLEKGIETLKSMKQPGMDLTTGLTRTAARSILNKKGIDVPEKADPIDILTQNFGAEVLMDTKNVVEELIELQRAGKATKNIDDVLQQEGLFDIKMRKEPPQGYTDEELAEIQKAIDEEDILLKFDPTDREPNAVGGRVGFAIGSLPKGIQALAKQLNKKFGKGTIKTADEMERPKSVKEKKMFEEFEARNPDPKRKLTDDEIKDYEEELGDSEIWMSEGTVEEAEQALKRQKEYEAAMYVDYRAGRLDPKPGEKGRREFLESKLEEMEMSGDKKLMTRDEIEELSNMDLEAEMEQFKNTKSRLQKKYKGVIDEDLLSKMMVDNNAQRLAELEATIDEALTMQSKGMPDEEIISMFKKTPRTKQAGGGLAYLMGL